MHRNGLEWSIAGAGKIHDVQFLFADVAEDSAPQTADLSHGQFAFGQQKDVDVAAPRRGIRAGSEEECLAPRCQLLAPVADGGVLAAG